MARTQDQLQLQQTDPSTENPAVGLIASTENTETISSTILRAAERGHEVFVTHPGNPKLEAVHFAEQLGARILHPNASDPDRETLRELLVATAAAESYPGLIFQAETDTRIDHSESQAALEDGGFCVPAASTTEDSPSDSLDVLVGIPAYNEAHSIAAVVDEVAEYADQILVVNDGSADETAARARNAGAIVVEHDENRGYGATLKTTFEEAERRSAEHLVLIDGDGQHDASDVPTLVDTQREGTADIVIGSRFGEESETDLPLYRRFGLTVVNALTNLSMGVVRPQSCIRDTQSGFRAYNARAIESLAADKNIGDHMDASTDILHHAHQKDYDIEEVGTTIDYDVEDASSHNPISHGFVLVSNLLKTIERDRPIISLGVPGFISAFAGLGFGYWTFSQYISTGIFPRGLAIISTFFILVGVFACFTAIILHSLNAHLSDASSLGTTN